MLKYANTIVGCKVSTLDGIIGDVDDILLYTGSLTLRYLVVDVGWWLEERLILLYVKTIESINEDDQIIHIPISKRDIELSPDVFANNPISVEAELILSKFWRWSTFSVEHLPKHISENVSFQATHSDKEMAENMAVSHLISAQEIEGYHIESTDGNIGYLENLIVDTDTWQVEYLMANIGNRFFKNIVLIPCTSLENICWADRKMQVSLSSSEIKKSPEFNSGSHLITRDFEKSLNDYYAESHIGK